MAVCSAGSYFQLATDRPRRALWLRTELLKAQRRGEGARRRRDRWSSPANAARRRPSTSDARPRDYRMSSADNARLVAVHKRFCSGPCNGIEDSHASGQTARLQHRRPALVRVRLDHVDTMTARDITPIGARQRAVPNARQHTALLVHIGERIIRARLIAHVAKLRAVARRHKVESSIV